MNDQAMSLRNKLAQLSQESSAKTIAFISGKGGVGKSNIAINFSLSLQKQNKKVLLIDFDIGMGNVEVLIGKAAKKSIIDMFEEHLPISDVIEQGPNQLHFISGGSGLTSIFGLDEEKKDLFFTEYHNLMTQYDYIIFDMGAGVTPDMMFFILASDECIVITTPEPTSITDGYGMIKHVINHQPEMPIYVIMNRSETIDSGLQTLYRFRRVIKQFIGRDIILLGNLPDDDLVKTAVTRQIPFILLNKRAPISRAVNKMVGNYLSNKTIKNEKTSSFIQKIKGYIRKRS